jgi:Copper resistance protein D
MDFPLVVRTVHVVAATIVVGGTWVMAAALRAPLDAGAGASMAARFEWLFWGAFGVIVATGIGNAGAFGATLPSDGTTWGAVFTYKLGAVVLLGALSMVRTLVVARDLDVRDTSTARLARLYVRSAVVGSGVVVLAEVLAHGD